MDYISKSTAIFINSHFQLIDMALFKKLFGKDDSDEYVEIDLNAVQSNENKVIVKPFVLREFDDSEKRWAV